MRTPKAKRQRAFLNIELVVAMGVLVAVVLPVAFGFQYEAKSLRGLYRDAVAMQLLDGEMDVLAAGEWKDTPDGRREFTPRGKAAKNLPPGRFFVTRDSTVIRLEWIPDRGRKMKREVKLP